MFLFTARRYETILKYLIIFVFISVLGFVYPNMATFLYSITWNNEVFMSFGTPLVFRWIILIMFVLPAYFNVLMQCQRHFVMQFSVSPCTRLCIIELVLFRVTFNLIFDQGKNISLCICWKYQRYFMMHESIWKRKGFVRMIACCILVSCYLCFICFCDQLICLKIYQFAEVI